MTLLYENIDDEVKRVYFTLAFFIAGTLIMATRMICIIAFEIENEQNLSFLKCACFVFEQIIPYGYVIIFTHYSVYKASQQQLDERAQSVQHMHVTTKNDIHTVVCTNVTVDGSSVVEQTKDINSG